MIAAALGHRPLLDEARDRDERRIEDGDREHQQREQDGRDGRPGDGPARRERERGESEAEHLAPRVAHEDGRSPLRTQVEGEESRTCEAEREREHEDGRVVVLRDGVDREVPAGDDSERRRQAVHVVEQVERIRDPDEPEEADRPRDDLVADDLDVEPAGEHDHRGRDLRGQLRDGTQVAEVVDESGGEDERDTGEDPAELSAPLDRSDRECEKNSSDEAPEDADASERRCWLSVPALVGRDGHEPSACRRAEEE